MDNADGIGISNEIEAETASVTFSEGQVLMIMSKDKI
jgi:thiamine pyrophosphokinase